MKLISGILMAACAIFTISQAQTLQLNSSVYSDHTSSSHTWGTVPPGTQTQGNTTRQDYQRDQTKQVVALVKDAAELIRTKGENAFPDLRAPGSRWRKSESYIFVFDTNGNSLVHADPELEGKNQLDLKDVAGKPIVQGIIGAATMVPEKPEGWYHYQFPVPGGLLPRWKSSYVQLVKAPTGKSYVVGSGMYTDRMERAFVVDMVKAAIGEIEKNGEAAFSRFRDPSGPFIAKDAYLIIIDPEGVELLNPAFPSFEGKNLLDLKDSQGKYLIREMLKTVEDKGAGWVEYMWPKPGESFPTQKSTYVSKAKLGNSWVLVGCGVYLDESPKATAATKRVTAPELTTLVRNAVAELEKRGEKAYPDFRKKGSRWYKDDTYLFVWTMDGTRVFHAADPAGEGDQVSNLKDVLGRPYGKRFLEAAATPTGEGWEHYMFPKPGDIFPTWKSSFVKRVTFPDGKQYLVGSGVYNMKMDKAFIENVVGRAAALLEKQGEAAFPEFRDKTSPFLFMDTYVFIAKPDGTTLVNPGQPSLEGKNLLNAKDVKGKLFVQEYTNAAMKNGSAWVDYYWYKPGEDTPVQKHTFVRKVQHGNDTYIVGSGYYAEEDAKKAKETRDAKIGKRND